jgi:hypothetical protein
LVGGLAPICGLIAELGTAPSRLGETSQRSWVLWALQFNISKAAGRHQARASNLIESSYQTFTKPSFDDVRAVWTERMAHVHPLASEVRCVRVMH